MIKFLHTADLHLDSPFKGISQVDEYIGGMLRDATFRAFDRLVDVCIERQVDFLLVAGDVYDGADRSLRAQLRFKDGLERLDKEGISTFVAHGNHDPLDGWAANLKWPGNTHIFGGARPEVIKIHRGDEPIAMVHGMSFKKKGIKENLSLTFPERSGEDDDLFHIGLLHCNVGSETGHDPYAPCTVDDLLSRGYDYWALGHVHTSAVLHEDPTIHYPGNIQGLDPNETGDRGCTLVDVSDNGKVSLEFVKTCSVRWSREDVDIEGLYREDELRSRLMEITEDERERADGCPSICRLNLVGRGHLFHSLARTDVIDDLVEDLRDSERGERDPVWVERIENRTHPELERERLKERTDFIGDLVNIVDEVVASEDELDALSKELDPLMTSPGGRKFLDAISREELIALLGRAENLCLDRLLGSMEDED